MKALFPVALALAFTLGAPAQNPLAADPAPGGRGRLAIKEQGLHHRVWQRILSQTNAAGQVTIATNRAFVELATGLNYQDEQGRWQETKEEFEVVPGWAVARKGPHKVSLAYNLNSAGPVELVMPDGKRMRSQILGLVYLDQATGRSVTLADIKDCAGQVLRPNRVLYEDAFEGLKADVLYTYTRLGLEQDLVIRSQPPKPEAFGLSSSTTRLVVMTEFLSAPTPVEVAATSRSAPVPGEEQDVQLDFGAMRIGRGTAFSLAATNGASRVPVIKKWVVYDGRSCLLEEVPVEAVRPQLDALPKQASLNRARRSVLAQLAFPQPLKGAPPKKTMQLAQAMKPSPGFVLDYVEINSNAADYTLTEGTTYLVTGNYEMTGTLTIEGGAVVKYYAGGITAGTVVWKTSAYRPAVFTTTADNSIGEPLDYWQYSGSIYDWFLRDFPTVENAHIRNAPIGVQDVGVVRNCQFINCRIGIEFRDYSPATQVFNALFDNCNWVMNDLGYNINTAPVFQNVTADDCYYFYSTYQARDAILTNCLLTEIVSPSGLPANPPADVVILTNRAGVYQTAVGGSHYLATNSAYRDCGTTTIDPGLLADLRKKTTFAPLVHSGVLTAATTFAPQTVAGGGIRDTNAPDLGYHYDPLDHIFEGLTANASLLLTNGVIVGFKHAMLSLGTGAHLVSAGAPVRRNLLVQLGNVQEQSWAMNYSDAMFPAAGAGSGIDLRYTTVLLEPPLYYSYTFDRLYDSTSSGELQSLLMEGCELFVLGRALVFQNTDGDSVFAVKNSLFSQMTVSVSTPGQASCSNNTLIGSSFQFENGGAYTWPFKNNAVADYAQLDLGYGYNCEVGYNAYVNGGTYGRNSTLQPTEIDGGSVQWVKGPLGDYYQGTNSPLLNVGSTNANLLGFYHYTTLTNQTREGSSTIDIGYHYLAVDGSGNPVDTDGDGVPDYLEDANGNGNGADDAESWLFNRFNGLHPGRELQVYTPLRQ